MGHITSFRQAACQARTRTSYQVACGVRVPDALLHSGRTMLSRRDPDESSM